MRAIATSLLHPETAYVSYRDLEDGGLKYMGVAKTTDTGRTWNLVWKEDINPTGKARPQTFTTPGSLQSSAPTGPKILSTSPSRIRTPISSTPPTLAAR